MSSPSVEALDRVAVEAMTEVSDGMRLGLGTGRAAEAFIRRLGGRVSEGLTVRCLTTSVRSEKLASSLGIPLETLETLAKLDVAFDGADEVTPELDLTKGLGGALLRERVIAHVADRFVVLVTPEKRVPKLGTRTHIPIEVVPFAEAVVRRAFEALGGAATTRSDGDSVYHTDNGNLILDTQFGPIDDPRELDAKVRLVPGVVDTGLFLGMADVVLVGSETAVDRLERA
jgi:ribose 5-phosphate isomerase A